MTERSAQARELLRRIEQRRGFTREIIDIGNRSDNEFGLAMWQASKSDAAILALLAEVCALLIEEEEADE